MQWWLLAYLGVIASGVCFFLWNYGARRVTPVKLAIMNNLKIPLAALISLLLFREQPNMFLLALGCLLILSSFLIAPIPLKKAARKQASGGLSALHAGWKRYIKSITNKYKQTKG